MTSEHGALTLAIHYLAPNSTRRRQLKGLKSPNRGRAIAGVRNAAWDLTLISEWVLRVGRQESDARLVLLTSFDRSLHRLARSVVDLEGTSVDVEDRLRADLMNLWGADAGKRLADAVCDCYASLENPDRQVNQQPAPDFIDRCIADGEASVRGGQPS